MCPIRQAPADPEIWGPIHLDIQLSGDSASWRVGYLDPADFWRSGNLAVRQSDESVTWPTDNLANRQSGIQAFLPEKAPFRTAMVVADARSLTRNGKGVPDGCPDRTSRGGGLVAAGRPGRQRSGTRGPGRETGMNRPGTRETRAGHPTAGKARQEVQVGEVDGGVDWKSAGKSRQESRAPPVRWARRSDVHSVISTRPSRC